ncbi:MAG: hypothetical protein IJ493_05900 [Clostridia bacterium]|nr:hypothetical protein [Clostridia bacterium]
MKNFSTANFEPESALSREQFVSLLNQFVKSPVVSADKDADGVFTREEAMTIIADVLKLTATDVDIAALSKFSDTAEISEDAKNAVAALVAGGYIHDTLTFDLSEHDIVYGTAALTYAEFYSGDVSTIDYYGIDGITSATVEKYKSFNGNMYTNFTEDKTDGYNILGVKNVNVAVAAEDYEAYVKLNPTFKVLRNAPEQYKTVSIVDGKAVYSPTNFNVEKVVTDASAELQTGSTWGDYQINVTENSTAYIPST